MARQYILDFNSFSNNQTTNTIQHLLLYDDVCAFSLWRNKFSPWFFPHRVRGSENA
jgi:hypothetical protein